MELGNLPSGHSRGEYGIDRSGVACIRFTDLMTMCGIDSYGRLDDDVEKRMNAAGYATNDLVLTDRGLEWFDPEPDGRLLLRTRAYWWGDDDDPEADKPNLEIPALGLEVRWYKYMMRDAYANQPFDLGLVEACEHLLKPVTRLLWAYVDRPLRWPLAWSHEPGSGMWVCRVADPRADLTRVMYTNGFITVDEDAELPYMAEMISEDGMFHTVDSFTSLDKAKTWCGLHTVEWMGMIA
ncbi:hypothetical protein [Bifidobacterium felsineum]|uniref:hypothetical protein n=1 Tax=Bifidobacterium felsineum TaxID=2045440 RepID=UPI001BDCA2B3|nr:hypothetical protein [Bifidobacterium felsineum]MBT1164960.1 hypothetical protein [Bifidobacterium felsineum]